MATRAMDLVNERTFTHWIEEVRGEMHADELCSAQLPFMASSWYSAETKARIAEEARQRLLNSPCARCRESAGMSMYPSHTPNVKGHEAHCTCDYCF